MNKTIQMYTCEYRYIELVLRRFIGYFDTTGLESGKQNMMWLQYRCYVLTKQHKTILCGGSLLDDIHIGAAQFMISRAVSIYRYISIGGRYKDFALS